MEHVAPLSGSPSQVDLAEGLSASPTKTGDPCGEKNQRARLETLAREYFEMKREG